MSFFSQSLCLGDNTLQALLESEKGTIIQPMKVLTPSRSASAINSDSDIIEESPTNHSSVYSYRERKHFNKSKASNKKRKTKSRSAEQLTTSKLSDCSKGTQYSQFLRSDYDFDDAILKLLPGNTSKTNNICDIVKSDEKELENEQKIDSCFESDMFSDWAIPQNVSVAKPSTQIQANDQKDTSVREFWEDSFDVNDIDLNDVIQEKNKQLIEIDEQLALCSDNVTFTQNFMNVHDDDFNLNDGAIDLATSQFIEEGLESFKNSFTRTELAIACSNHNQMSTLHFKNSEWSFTLNYSDSTADGDEEVPVIVQNINEKSDSQSLKHLNSIDSWGKLAKVLTLLNISWTQLLPYFP